MKSIRAYLKSTRGCLKYSIERMGCGVKRLAVPLTIGVAVIVIFVGIPWMWNLPKQEVSRIQSSLPATGKLTAKEEAELVDESRRTLISGIGTIATIFGGIGLLLNYRATNRRLTLDTDKYANDRTQAESRLAYDREKYTNDREIAESRLTSERFAQAVEQLGSENTHIRLGGIYSLEQLAKDSPNDHWTVMEVLTAFIREESPFKLHFSPDNLDSFNHAEPAWNRVSSIANISMGVQAALSVIARNGDANGLRELDLSRTNLKGATIKQGCLDRVDLRGSYLGHALIERVSLNSALLDTCVFEKAKLSEVSFCQSRMRQSNFYGSRLSKVDLTGANLYGASLQGCDLHMVTLTDVNLNNTNLQLHSALSVVMDNAQLSGADLSNERGFEEEQITSALLCNTKLPKNMNLDPNRNCDELAPPF